MAKKYPNTYSVAIFACCREIYKPTKHCGMFGGTTADALKYYNRIAPIEFALVVTLSDDMKQKKKELEVEKFKQIQTIEEEKIKAKCKLIIKSQINESKFKFYLKVGHDLTNFSFFI